MTARKAVERVEQFGQRHGGKASVLGSAAVLAGVAVAMANLYAITEKNHYNKDQAEERFASKGDISYVVQRIDRHEIRRDIHVPMAELQVHFVPRAELDDRERRDERRMEEILKRLQAEIDRLSMIQR